MESMLSKKREIVGLLLQKQILTPKGVLERLEDPFLAEELHKALLAGADPHDLLQGVCSKKADFKSDELKVLFDYAEPPQKRQIQNFVDYFYARYRALSRILQNRQELQNLTGIGRLASKLDKEMVSIIGIVVDKQITKNENVVLALEDDSGLTKVIVNKSQPAAYAVARDVVPDEVIGVCGTGGRGIVFASSLVLPDVPIQTELKRAQEDVMVAVVADTHVGSGLFLEKEFDNFISWLEGNAESAQLREMAGKTKYVFFVGDLVDGVGIYPGQEQELAVKDIYRQYELVAGHLARIPKDKKIVICPGNHDAVRIGEPQPRLSKEFAKPVWDIPNALLLSNPCSVRISTTGVDFDFLLYHGYSFDYYGDTVESIRSSGRNISDRVDLIMRFLLQRRHLGPAHESTIHIPDPKRDPLVIEKPPDFFLSAHIHKAAVNAYRGVTTICASCFQAKTSFQEKVGHEPSPCQIPLINLKDRTVKMLDFTKGPK